MSYCDNCIHQQVCRFTKDIQKRESAPVEYLSGYTDGPTIKYAVNCQYKIVKIANQPSRACFGEDNIVYTKT